MKDEEKLLNAIHENHKRAYENTIAKKVKKEKKNRRKELLISIIIVVTALAIIFINGNITDKAIKECMQDGYNEGYCLSKLA